MYKGAGLPVGEVGSAGVANVVRNPGRFTRVCLGVLLAQALVSPSGAEVVNGKAQEPAIESCEEVGSLCLLDLVTKADPIVLELPTDPVIAVITATTAPPATTTTLPISTTTTTTPPKKSCGEIRDSVRARVPVPEGWKFNCTTRSINIDGLADPKTKVITLYFGDPEDTNERKQHVVAHEIGHAWQFSLGILSKGYSLEQLEKQADDFSYAYGYREGNKRGTLAGAIVTCKEFFRRGTDVCQLPPG